MTLRLNSSTAHRITQTEIEYTLDLSAGTIDVPKDLIDALGRVGVKNPDLDMVVSMTEDATAWVALELNDPALPRAHLSVLADAFRAALTRDGVALEPRYVPMKVSFGAMPPPGTPQP